jgi:hypothetical protein
MKSFTTISITRIAGYYTASFETQSQFQIFRTARILSATTRIGQCPSNKVHQRSAAKHITGATAHVTLSDERTKSSTKIQWVIWTVILRKTK